MLNTSKIYSMGKNVCVIKNGEPLNLLLTQTAKVTTPINKIVYSTTGENLGRVLDVELTNKFEVLALKLNNQSISPNKILNIGENIIVNLENKKIVLNYMKPKIKQKYSQNVVSILPKIETTNELNEDTKKDVLKINPSPIPARISGNIHFLIGRKVSKTIYGLNNEIIIKKDSLITNKNLENAKKHSKLAELTLYSLNA